MGCFMNVSEGIHVAIVGASGAVGVEMISCLERRQFPVKKLTLLASPRSAGKRLVFQGEEIVIQPLTKDSFAGVDIALFSAGGSISLEYAPIAVAAGAVVVDNSSAYRMDPKVPLVVPEINAEAVKGHSGIIANPNCSTAITLMALYPLHLAFGVKRVIASTYQAVSGTGAQAIEELARQSRKWASEDQAAWDDAQLSKSEVQVYPHQIAFNVLPHVDQFLATGYTKEEMKMENEGRKIMGIDDLRVSCTCVRVPVFRAHSISVNVEFERTVSLEAAREAIQNAKGIVLMDDPASKVYPMPLNVAGADDCAVGRLRVDGAFENGLAFWVVGDQLLKGAALNAVQIAECLI
jgi:aspartate-semialdehyde dehydrogenase